jgi:hypothetical protein
MGTYGGYTIRYEAAALIASQEVAGLIGREEGELLFIGLLPLPSLMC